MILRFIVTYLHCNISAKIPHRGYPYCTQCANFLQILTVVASTDNRSYLVGLQVLGLQALILGLGFCYEHHTVHTVLLYTTVQYRPANTGLGGFEKLKISLEVYMK